MMSANTCPGPTEGSWSMSPTISSAASSGVAFISACISMTSTMEASSTTSRSQSSGLSALRVNPPPLGSTSRSRWIVLASTPVASVMRLPRRAPGSRASKTRSGVWALALMTIFPSPFTRTNLSPEFTPSSAVQKAMPSRAEAPSTDVVLHPPKADILAPIARARALLNGGMASSMGLHPAARRQRHRRMIAPQTAGVDVLRTYQTAAANVGNGRASGRRFVRSGRQGFRPEREFGATNSTSRINVRRASRMATVDVAGGKRVLALAT